MRARPDRNTTAPRIFYLLAPLHELLQVGELARAVRVSEDDVLAPDVPHAMRDRAALPSVLLQRHDPDGSMRDVRRARRLRAPRTRYGQRMLRELVLVREAQRFRNRLVRRAVGDDQDLPAGGGGCFVRMRRAVGRAPRAVRRRLCRRCGR